MSLSLATRATRRVASLSEARTARQERAALRAQLDAYATPSERAEFDAILSRHSAEQLSQLDAAAGRRH